MTVSQFLNILKARWVLGIAVMVTVIALILAVSFLLLKTTYTATASVVVDSKPDPIAGNTPTAFMSSYMATQIDILQSNRVAIRAAALLKFDVNPEVQQMWHESTDGKGSFEAWLARFLRAGLEVQPSRESNVIDVSYKSQDPRFATAMANAWVKAYLDTVLELRVDPARSYSSFFDERLRQAREQLEKSQARLSAMQKEKGIVISDERLDVETQRMNELSAQLVMLRTQSADANSRANQARARSDQSPDVLSNPVVASLKTEMLRQEALLQQLQERLGESHPQVQEARASIAGLRSKIAGEVERVSASIGMSSNISNAREAEVTAAYEAQRARVMKLKAQRDELAVLENDVLNAQKAYDAVQSRLTQVSLESQTTQTNVSMLNPAVEPFEPSFPKPFIVVPLAVMAGGLLGLVAILAMEALDRRLRTAEDIVRGLQVPVIGAMPRPNKRRFLRRPEASWLQQHVLPQLPAGPKRA